MTASRPLDLYAYDILSSGETAQVAGIDSQWEVLQALREWGLRVSPLVRRAATIDDILDYHRDLESRRDDLGFEIDGIVIKLDDLAARDEVGWTSRHPRWAFAFKFPPRKEVTRVLSIVPSVGRSGVVTPVALMLPVEIGGVTVARATLHNREEVARKDIREGDRVRVQRAGDVIPQVIERLAEPDREPDRERAPRWEMPKTCPSCGTPLVERGPFTVCPNGFECPAQLAGRIVHLASRDALDIEGLGDETAKLFVSEGLVQQLPDLFDLRADQLVQLEGFAEKSSQKLVEALKKASHAELPRFLFGLGIPEVGIAVARDLARHFGTFDRLRHATEEELQEVSGVGPRMAEQITTFFRDPKNAAILDELLTRLSLKEQSAAPTASVQPLAGKKFVFTGGLTRLSRRDAQTLVENLGARATGSVSKATDYVVVGEDPGSKADDAKKLGVTTLDEEGFLALLRDLGAAV
jgi:DNA ligase (NAD+)